MEKSIRWRRWAIHGLLIYSPAAVGRFRAKCFITLSVSDHSFMAGGHQADRLVNNTVTKASWCFICMQTVTTRLKYTHICLRSLVLCYRPSSSGLRWIVLMCFIVESWDLWCAKARFIHESMEWLTTWQVPYLSLFFFSWHDLNWIGSLWSPGCIVALYFFPKDIASLSIIYLSWADPTASICGRLWGQYTPRFGKKSLAGSSGAVVTGALVTYVFYSVFSQDTSYEAAGLPFYVFALYGGLVAGFSEALGDFVYLDDNLVIPVVSSTLLWVYMGFGNVYASL